MSYRAFEFNMLKIKDKITKTCQKKKLTTNGGILRRIANFSFKNQRRLEDSKTPSLLVIKEKKNQTRISQRKISFRNRDKIKTLSVKKS